MKKFSQLTFLTFLLSQCSFQEYSEEKDREMVTEILTILDDHTLDMEKRMSVYSNEIIHMGQGEQAITNLSDLRTKFVEDQKWGYSEMKHEAYEIHSYESHVIVRGGVKGTWYAKDL